MEPTNDPTVDTRIDVLRRSLAEHVEQIDALLSLATEDRELTDDEAAQVATLDAEATEIEANLRTAVAAAERRELLARANAAIPTVSVTSEPLTYSREDSSKSFFLDIARAQIQNDRDAVARLERHGKEVAVELPKRAAARSSKESRTVEATFERRVNPNRTDGQGGNFVPPLWLIDDYIAFLRAGRVTANLARNMDLPGGTDSINIPKIATGTSTAVQTADAGAVSSTDLTDSSISVPVRTIAGQQDISMQLLEQSPISFDEVVFADLIADYNQKLDVQVLSGSGSSGQVLGVDGAGGNSVSFTSGSPTAALLYPIIAQALSQVARLRFRGAQALVMHPRRWYWLLAALDSSNRPFVTTYPANGYNPMGVGVAGTEGPVGSILGVDVYCDANVTTVDGTGTNQDRIYAAVTDDYLLWEGGLRSRAMSEVLSGTLQVRLQVYNYVAFTAARYPVGTSIISGTGLTAPAGF